MKPLPGKLSSRLIVVEKSLNSQVISADATKVADGPATNASQTEVVSHGYFLSS